MFALYDIVQGNKETLKVYGPDPLDLQLTFHAAQHDSRKVAPGDLYVAIQGARSDGHTFIPDCIEAGAYGALCTRYNPELPSHFLQLVVPDPITALQNAASVRAHRQEWTTRIGITGTSGKTTTKDAIAVVLSRIAPTLKTYASYNNELGYPLTLLAMEPEHRYAVLEMGAERVGELASLCETIARPHWSVITSIGSAHLHHFGSVANVEIAKSELVQCLSPDDFAILNYDDPKVRAMAEKTAAQVLFYGLGEGATIRGTDVSSKQFPGSHFTLHIAEQSARVQLALLGRHGISAALAAAAVGYLAQVPFEEICSALETLALPQGRGVLLPGPHDSIVIDDTYNAIRESIIAMTTMMKTADLVPHGKRWAILGELLEQGVHTEEEHRATGKAIANNIDYLITIGEYAALFGEGARSAGLPASCIHHFPVVISDKAALEAAKQKVAQFVHAHATKDDVILVKGSRGVQMETLLKML